MTLTLLLFHLLEIIIYIITLFVTRRGWQNIKFLLVYKFLSLSCHQQRLYLVRKSNLQQLQIDSNLSYGFMCPNHQTLCTCTYSLDDQSQTIGLSTYVYLSLDSCLSRVSHNLS